MSHQVLPPFLLMSNISNAIRGLKQRDERRKINNDEMDRLEMLSTNAQNVLKTYNQIFAQYFRNINDPLRNLVETRLSNCSNQLKWLMGSLNRIELANKQPMTAAFPTILKERFDIFVEAVEKLNLMFEEIGDSIQGLRQIRNDANRQRDTEPDTFKVINMVPRNPIGIVIDFEKNGSPEAALKSAIYNNTSLSTVTALANGMSGVGKTCALRACGLHKDWKTRFPDGVLYMTLGAESNEAQLVWKIADFVKRTGGYSLYRRIAIERDLDVCVNLASEWFRDHICLYLIDDVCCQNGIDSSVSEVLAGLATHEKSRVAFTTRDSKLKAFKTIPFEIRNKEESEKILLYSADLKNLPRTTEEVLAFEKLREKTGGLPIALNVIGSHARYILLKGQVSEMNIWSYVCRQYEEYGTLLSGEPFYIQKNSTVLNVLLQSLIMVESQSDNRNSLDLFSGLCILRKRHETPVDVIQRMWKMSFLDTMSQVKEFERFNIMEINPTFKGEMRECVTIHDLFLDVSRHLAERKEGFIKETSKRVLDSYINEHESECSMSNGGLRSFEIFVSLDDDEFLFRNLFQLLDNAGLQEEGFSLLCDPRWLSKQMDVCKWKQIDDDIVVILQSFEQESSRNTKVRKITFLKMLRAALSESERHIIHAPTCISGMLYPTTWPPTKL